MKDKKVITFILIFLFIGLTFVQSYNASSNILSNEIVSLNGNNHQPIYINDNDDFTSENGVTGGSGTENDPYIIENWIIKGNDSIKEGIFINNTDAYFIIRNCSVKNFFELSYGKGILLSNVENGIIKDTTTNKNYYGIMIRDNSKNIKILNCSIGNSDGWNSRGIACYDSSNISITSSKFHDVNAGILLAETPYATIKNSSIYNCSGIGIWIPSETILHDIIIRDCKIYNIDGDGILVGWGEYRNRKLGNVLISNCELYKIGVQPQNTSSSFSAITFWGCRSNIIENCNIHHNGNGILFSWSTDNLIRNCSIFNHNTNGGFGAIGIDIYNIHLLPIPKVWSSGNKIINCDIYNNDVGLLPETGKTIVYKNNFYNNSISAIVTGLFSYLKINDNNIYSNGFLEKGDGVKITRLSYADLRNNWWGSDDGPDTLLNPGGGGDTLYRFFSIARFRPWATEPIPDAGVQ